MLHANPPPPFAQARACLSTGTPFDRRFSDRSFRFPLMSIALSQHRDPSDRCFPDFQRACARGRRGYNDSNTFRGFDLQGKLPAHMPLVTHLDWCCITHQNSPSVNICKETISWQPKAVAYQLVTYFTFMITPITPTVPTAKSSGDNQVWYQNLFFYYFVGLELWYPWVSGTPHPFLLPPPPPAPTRP